MERREALKLLASAAVLPVLSRSAFSLFRGVHDGLPATPTLKTLNPHQDATLTAITEMIIPQTDTPGAKAARVNEFIDTVLTDWYDDEDKARFLAGLADVDTRSQKLFSKNFVDGSVQEQTILLTSLDEELTQAREEASTGFGRRGKRRVPAENFFYMMKQLTLVGYYTSQVGEEQELHWEAIPSSHAGCVALDGEAAK